MDIDRPAYLLAYQGMMLHLRNVILRGRKPDAFAQREWENMLKNLRKDDTWDKETFDRAKQCGKEKTVLCMPNEVRKKFEYWKDLRNICAHYKEYHFIKAHTLTLYSFIAQYFVSVFNGLPYPYTLESRIKQELLDGGLSKRTEFEAMCKSLSLEVPNALKRT